MASNTPTVTPQPEAKQSPWMSTAKAVALGFGVALVLAFILLPLRDGVRDARRAAEAARTSAERAATVARQLRTEQSALRTELSRLRRALVRLPGSPPADAEADTGGTFIADFRRFGDPTVLGDGERRARGFRGWYRAMGPAGTGVWRPAAGGDAENVPPGPFVLGDFTATDGPQPRAALLETILLTPPGASATIRARLYQPSGTARTHGHLCALELDLDGRAMQRRFAVLPVTADTGLPVEVAITGGGVGFPLRITAACANPALIPEGNDVELRTSLASVTLVLEWRLDPRSAFEPVPGEALLRITAESAETEEPPPVE